MANSEGPRTHVSETYWGQLKDGSAVTMVTLANSNGIEVDIISYGGIITRLLAPDSKGNLENIVLSLDSLEAYVTSSPFFGALIGRYGNRIANGQFKLNNTQYQLSVNDGKNHLHGGAQGFDKKNWSQAPFVTATTAGVTMALTSEDGDQGYPGTLNTSVVYELNNDNVLSIKFSANSDKTTFVNLTAHSYFNLAGSGSILDHTLMIPAKFITPVGDGLIPTGEFEKVAGTPFDFRKAKPIGQDIEKENQQLALGPGYDHNWVLKKKADGKMELAARLAELKSGRILEVWSPEPGVQFYSGNFLDGTLTGNGVTHGYRSGLCLEPQHFPDSPNHPNFPSTVLQAGDTYSTEIQYRFLTE